MKAIIYAGIGLFSVASVYGIADYFQSRKSGKLDGLYQEEKMPEENRSEQKTPFALPVSTKTELSTGERNSKINVVKLKKARMPEKKIRLEDFSRGRIEEPVKMEMILESKAKEILEMQPEKIKADLPEAEKATVEPERRLNLEMFSRAPLKKSMKPTKKKAKME
ncbi:MAG: hypothetical protein IPI66_01375 [Chitinophagaceae bacterium]|nr:hypothetical protein [Chitinophagaceae bacterium]MBL0054837.1 hypothetical protein [Chitinophagaceae bacterium]